MHGAATLPNLDTVLLMAPFASLLILAIFRLDERFAGRADPERPQEPVLRGGSRSPWQTARSGSTMLEGSRIFARRASPMGKPVCNPVRVSDVGRNRALRGSSILLKIQYLKRTPGTARQGFAYRDQFIKKMLT